MRAAIPFPPISPEIFAIDIGDMHLALRWYALAYVVGIVLGWLIAARAVRSPELWPGGRPPVDVPRLEELVTGVILGVILGGRLGYALFYRPDHYLSDPLAIFRVWEGGMSFHGGFLGVCVAVLWFWRRHRPPLLSLADLLALATPPGLMLGRIANFINAELWGRPTDLPWGVIFPGPAAQACGQLAGPCARHPSQLYEAALEGLLLGILLLWLAWRRRGLTRPGMIFGTFLAGYGLARFAVEFVRQPDLQFVGPGNPLGLAVHVGGWGLTMGQLLSLPMIAAGLWLIRRGSRSPGGGQPPGSGPGAPQGRERGR